MPLEIGPLSRREFVTSIIGAAGALSAMPTSAWAADPTVETLALYSDIHIAADPQKVMRHVNMSDNLREVIKQTLTLSERPSHLLVNGDCACLTGQEGDYATLVGLLSPLREAGLPVTLALGNHDDRDQFVAAFTDRDESPVADKQATLLSTDHVNWFILDSLEKVNSTPGKLGEAQLQWLDRALSENRDKPAFVMAHHNVEHRKHLKNAEVVAPIADARIPAAGITDDELLIEVMNSHPHVSAFFCGHTHQWNVVQSNGILYVNLPCVAYTFTPPDPNGWVICRQSRDKAQLELWSLDTSHKFHGLKVDIPYRGA